MLVFDTVIFSLTLYKAITIGRGVRLLDVMVRDGELNRPLPYVFGLKTSIPGAMYFSYEIFGAFTEKDHDVSEQGPLRYEFGKYFNPSGTP